MNKAEVSENNKISYYFSTHFATIDISLANQNKFSSFLSNFVFFSISLVSPTPIEIYSAIFSLNTNINPKLDIPSYFLKVAANVLLHFLAFFIHHVFISGIFPDNLKIVKVLSVFKAGSKTGVNNYRPISLLTCLFKLLEKLILKRITSFLDKHEVIYPNQYGFRKKCYTSHAFFDTLSSCSDAISAKKI